MRLVRDILLGSSDQWHWSSDAFPPVAFCVRALVLDGLMVPPFDRHPDGDGGLREFGLDAETWSAWLAAVLRQHATIDDRADARRARVSGTDARRGRGAPHPGLCLSRPRHAPKATRRSSSWIQAVRGGLEAADVGCASPPRLRSPAAGTLERPRTVPRSPPDARGLPGPLRRARDDAAAAERLPYRTRGRSRGVWSPGSCGGDGTRIPALTRQAPSGSGRRGASIHTSCAVFAAPIFDRAFARWCFTVECDTPRRSAAAFSDPATRTAVTTTTSRSVARAGARSLTPAASPRPATRPGLDRDGRLLSRAQHLWGARPRHGRFDELHPVTRREPPVSGQGALGRGAAP